MKKPEDWYSQWLDGDFGDMLSFVKDIQLEAYNQAIDDAAKNADIGMKKKSNYGKYRKWQKVKDTEVDLFQYEVQYFVDKESISKLKK